MVMPHVCGEEISSLSTESKPISIIDQTAAYLDQKLGVELVELRVERLIIGVFFTGIKLSNGCAGVAYTPPELIDRASQHILKERMTEFAGLPVSAILQHQITSPFSEIIRLATLNALSLLLFDQYETQSQAGLADFATLYTRRKVCLVGAIIPLLKQLKQYQPQTVAIIDKKEATQQEAKAGWGTFYQPDELPRQLASCDTAIFTGAAVANGSIEELLALTPPEAAIAIVGPSAGFIPDALFERGVAVVGTSVVTAADTALRILAEGGGGYHLFGKCMDKLNLINRARLAQLGLTL